MSGKPREFIMILRNTEWDQGRPKVEVAEMIDRYQAWFDRLLESGAITGGRPLLEGGRIVSSTGDGPFVETKEVIGGYIQITAGGMDEAVKISSTFPPLEYGVTIELRELIDECPVSRRHAVRLLENVPLSLQS